MFSVDGIIENWLDDKAQLNFNDISNIYNETREYFIELGEIIAQYQFDSEGKCDELTTVYSDVLISKFTNIPNKGKIANYIRENAKWLINKGVYNKKRKLIGDKPIVKKQSYSKDLDFGRPLNQISDDEKHLYDAQGNLKSLKFIRMGLDGSIINHNIDKIS